MQGTSRRLVTARGDPAQVSSGLNLYGWWPTTNYYRLPGRGGIKLRSSLRYRVSVGSKGWHLAGSRYVRYTPASICSGISSSSSASMTVPGRSGHACMHVDVDVDVDVQVCVNVTWYAGPWAGECV